jgi:hypothetical protein
MLDSESKLRFINFDYLFGKIYDFFKWIIDGLFGGSILGALSVLFGIAAIAFLYVIFYSSIRIRELEAEEEQQKKAKLLAEIPEVAPRHDKWQTIQAHMLSRNQAEWRMAIIEADTILEEMTIAIGLQGDTLGDRLKGATPADFRNVQAAWEAHKVRNRIAHDGSNFELTQAEANRIIRMYEDVFNEFNYI